MDEAHGVMVLPPNRKVIAAGMSEAQTGHAWWSSPRRSLHEELSSASAHRPSAVAAQPELAEITALCGHGCLLPDGEHGVSLPRGTMCTRFRRSATRRHGFACNWREDIHVIEAGHGGVTKIFLPADATAEVYAAMALIEERHK